MDSLRNRYDDDKEIDFSGSDESELLRDSIDRYIDETATSSSTTPSASFIVLDRDLLNDNDIIDVIDDDDDDDNNNNNNNNNDDDDESLKNDDYAIFASPPRALTPKGTPHPLPKFISHSASKVNDDNDFLTPSPSGRRFSMSRSAHWFHSLSRGKRKEDPLRNRRSKNKKSLTSVFNAESIRYDLTNNNNVVIDKLNESDWDIPMSSGANTSGSDRQSFPHHDSSPTSKFVNSTSAIDADYSTLNLTELALTERFSKKNSESMGELENGGNGGNSPHPRTYYTIDTKRLASRHKKSIREKKLLYGIKQFNLEPKRGIVYLFENEFLERDNPKGVASFLYREGRLSKKQIGQFLGDHHEFNREVLKEFVKCHEFTHLILVQALRQFLWSFRLPGEAMQIDRVMEAFASHYCQQNENLFDEVDTCYILSFSIIMLNTALHNPNIRHKITLEQFVKQNRGINSGKDLPADILELIYRNIKEEPFKIPKETYDDLMYTFFSPEKEGWLLKQGGSWKNWKRRWFVLSDRCLYYFQHTAENVPKGIIPLENIKVRSVDDKDGKLYCFELYSESNSLVKGCKTDSKGTVVQGNHRVYRMSASSSEDRELWVQCIRDSIKEHPFYDIIASKKLALRRKSLKGPSQVSKPVTSHSIATSTTTLNNEVRPAVIISDPSEPDIIEKKEPSSFDREASSAAEEDEDPPEASEKSELHTITSFDTETENELSKSED